ncbi:MAG: zinc metalloprotease HtpX [Wenzhouxiangella sp.]
MANHLGRLTGHRLHNSLQMALLIAGLTLVLAIPAWLLAGGTGVTWALFLVVVSAMMAGTIPPRVILSRAGARRVAPQQAPALYELLEILYRRAGLDSEPALYHVPSPQLNAFAVGDRRAGGIAVTEGLLRHLDDRQLAGVLAHEVSHLRHNDTRVMAMAAAMTHLTAAGATLVQIVLIVSLPWILAGELLVSWLMLVAVAFAPSISTLLQLALSRNREFTAVSKPPR